MNQCARAIKAVTGELPNLVAPVGDPGARIGILLDYEPLSIAAADLELGFAANQTALPWGLKEAVATPSFGRSIIKIMIHLMGRSPTSGYRILEKHYC